jgi:hypothetical protein
LPGNGRAGILRGDFVPPMSRPLTTVTLILSLLWQSLVWALPPMAQERSELLAHALVHEQTPGHHHHEPDASLHPDNIADEGLPDRVTPSHHHHDPAHQPPGLPVVAAVAGPSAPPGETPSSPELMPASAVPDGPLRPPRA